jgi:lambda repressor-like predicted transcriptional regulator
LVPKTRLRTRAEQLDEFRNVIERVDSRIKELGLSPRAVSKSAGLSPDYVYSIRKQSRKGTQISIREESFCKLAEALGTTPGALWPERFTGFTLTGDPKDDVSREPLIAELVRKLPPKGYAWPADDRVTWVEALLSSFQLVYGAVEKIEVRKQAADRR